LSTHGAAIEALAGKGGAAVPPLIEALKDRNYYVRTGAARALGRMGLRARQAIPALIQALKVEEVNRTFFAEALAAMGPEAKDAAPTLPETPDDKVATVRHAAARALGAIGRAAEPAKPALARLLTDPIDFVQRDAATALESIDRAVKEGM